LKTAGDADDPRSCRRACSRVGFGISSGDGACVKLQALGSRFSEGFRLEDQPVGIMQEPIESGVSCRCSTGSWLVTMLEPRRADPLFAAPARRPAANCFGGNRRCPIRAGLVSIRRLRGSG
jgi:hypothetical protein